MCMYVSMFVFYEVSYTWFWLHRQFCNLLFYVGRSHHLRETTSKINNLNRVLQALHVIECTHCCVDDREAQSVFLFYFFALVICSGATLVAATPRGHKETSKVCALGAGRKAEHLQGTTFRMHSLLLVKSTSGGREGECITRILVSTFKSAYQEKWAWLLLGGLTDLNCVHKWGTDGEEATWQFPFMSAGEHLCVLVLMPDTECLYW